MSDDKFDLNEIQKIFVQISGKRHTSKYRFFVCDHKKYYCKAATSKPQIWAFLVSRELINRLELPNGLSDNSLYTSFFNGGINGKNIDIYNKSFNRLLEANEKGILDKLLASNEKHIHISFDNSASVNTYLEVKGKDVFEITENEEILKATIDDHIKSNQEKVNESNAIIITDWIKSIIELLKDITVDKKSSKNIHTILGIKDNIDESQFWRIFSCAVILAIFPRIINDSSDFIKSIKEWLQSNGLSIPISEKDLIDPLNPIETIEEEKETIRSIRDELKLFSELLKKNKAEQELANKQKDIPFLNYLKDIRKYLKEQRDELLEEYKDFSISNFESRQIKNY